MAKVSLSPLITGISGSIGNLSFSKTSNGTIVFTKPYSSPEFSSIRHTYLDLYRQALYNARNCSDGDFATVLMFLQLYPRYLKNVSQINSSAIFHYAQLCFNDLLIGGVGTVQLQYIPEPLPINVLAVHLTGGRLIITFSRELNSDTEVALIFLSTRYGSVKCYLSDKTSYINYARHLVDSCDVTDGYVKRFGILPSINEYVCATVTFFDNLSGHILPDQTAFFKVIS